MNIMNKITNVNVAHVNVAHWSWFGKVKTILNIDEDGFGMVDNDALMAFKCGQCHALALAINKITGWRIVGVGGVPDSPNHCMVYCPQLERYVDIAGTVSEPYEKIVHHNMPRKLATRPKDYLKPNYRAAKAFARSVLRELNKRLVNAGFEPVAF